MVRLATHEAIEMIETLPARPAVAGTRYEKVTFELGPIPLGIRGEIDKIERET
jgi:hypothetical protein